jgi:hypothetical protein
LNTNESIQNKINDINKILLSSIEDKSIFDDCFKNHIIRPEREEYGSPEYKGRSIECPNYQNPFDFDITEDFYKESFQSFKETVNQCILLNALSDLFDMNKFVTNAFNKPNNNYYKLLETFAHKNDSKSTELFMDSVKECNAELDIWIVNISIHQCIATHRVMYTVRVGTEFKFQDE